MKPITIEVKEVEGYVHITMTVSHQQDKKGGTTQIGQTVKRSATGELSYMEMMKVNVILMEMIQHYDSLVSEKDDD